MVARLKGPLVAAIELDVRRIVREEFRAMLGRLVDTRPDAYTTRRGHEPPGWAAERWRETAPTIPGAHKPGRWWVVPVASYEAWVARQNSSPTPGAAPATTTATPRPWHPRMSAEAMGWRTVGENR
jgi:hypothetical protein